MSGTGTFNLAEKENDLLVKSQIERMFLMPLRLSWEEYYKTSRYRQLGRQDKSTQLEFIITSDCNLKCEYCYLHKYADDLVPPHCRDTGKILFNLEKFMQWWIQEGFHSDLDIFSGEIWQTPFGIKVLETIYEYVEKGAKVHTICIPSNCSFIMSKEYRSKIQKLIDKFKALGVFLVFSASVDGLPIEDYARPPRDPEKIGCRDEERFYDALFKFCKKNGFGYHPMVSAYAIEKWIDNLEWWKKSLKKYYPDEWREAYLNRIMMLEVRNGDWTAEKIQSYLNFQNYLMEDYLKECFEGNAEAYTLYVTRSSVRSDISSYYCGNITHMDGTMNCSMGRSMCVRLGDLAVVPCHRCAYERYVYGWLRQDDEGNITGDVKSNNAVMCALCNYSNIRKTSPHCGSCVVKDVCDRGCMGSQIEVMGDPLSRIPCVCELRIEKIFNSLQFLDRIGGLEILRNYALNQAALDREFRKLVKHENEFEGNYIKTLRPIYLSAVDMYEKLKRMKGII